MNGTIDNPEMALFQKPLQQYSRTMLHARSTIGRHPERGLVERAAAILAEGHVAHVGFVEDGQPFVIPLGYQFNPAEPDRLYLHGSPASRALERLASGAP